MIRFFTFALFAGLSLCLACSCPLIGKPDPAVGENYVESFAGLNVEMVWVPGGTFQMGSRLSPEEVAARYGGPSESFVNEHPLHEVSLDGFWVGKFEVTNEQFRHFIPDHNSGDYKGNSLNGDKQPATELTWEEAMEFCGWIAKATGRAYTLPSEAQWEYACRAGTDSVRSWGDDDADVGRYANVADSTAKSAFSPELTNRKDNVTGSNPFVETTDGFLVSAPVGSFEPNAFGLHDMIGNAIEYCLDFHDPEYYKRSPLKNPVNMTPSDIIVTRGGSWLHPSFRQRSALRGHVGMDHKSERVGFRICRNL
jgi:sulfatase modifying factor 1